MKMECREIDSWTFSGLVGAFLDLAITYLLLCGSTLAFFASKFLGVFGLCLPCPCNGLFGNPNSNNCLQRFLVDCPAKKLSSVQFSVTSKFPYDSIWAKDQQGCQLNLKLVKDRFCENGHVELEGEASCSSVSDSKRPQYLPVRESVSRNESIGFGSMNLPALKEGRFDLKGKGVMNQRSRLELRRRRSKGGYVSSPSPSSINKEITEEWFAPLDSNGGDDGGEAPMNIGFLGRVSHDFQFSDPIDEKKSTEKDALPVDEFGCKQAGFDGNEDNAIKVLEQALEEEHAARAALYLDLEKERCAAATAADEAMAMILRLQEEKASIEMEARQYQRMIEEKSEYDAEEMNILKEILVRRETEKHFLEKEVEAYCRMIFENENLDGGMHDMVDTQGQRASTSSLYLREDPVLMLQRISESIGKNEKAKDASKSLDYEVTSVESQNRTLAFGKELPIPDPDEDADFLKQWDVHRHPSIDEYLPHLSRSSDECNEEFQEKGMVFMESNPFAKIEVQRMDACSKFNKSSAPQGPNLLEKTIIPEGEEQKQSDNTSLCQGLAPKTTESCNETEINISYNSDDLGKHDKYAGQRSGDPCSSRHDTEPHVHDVHVIDDESNLYNEVNETRSEQMSTDATLNIPRKCNLPFEASGLQRISISSEPSTLSRLSTELEINRCSLDMPSGLPPKGPSRGKALLSDLRRNSLSALDCERLKIDTEVEWLRERLRIVQEGRGKLNFSAELREREKLQLKLLEDIASQLREIRHLTAPGKAVRQASLPLPSSKVMSKKRRCRSVSLGVNHST